jgi:SAM-dependent methyltransferase
MEGSIEHETPWVGRFDLDEDASRRASRRSWDDWADGYQAEHGDFLRDAGFVWCPEGVDEAEVRLLGDVAGRDVLEVGCGAAQCSRWLLTQGARPTGIDLSARQLQHSRRIDEETGLRVPVALADAVALPFSNDTFDVACSAFGAIPFAADTATLMREVARVLRPGGHWVFAVNHPFTWVFPDDPGPAGLVARSSYWDRRPYVERDEAGVATYVQHHRTLGDRIRELVAAGFVLDDLVEPEWPAGHDRLWGAWSPLRGAILPGTAIFVTHLGQ